MARIINLISLTVILPTVRVNFFMARHIALAVFLIARIMARIIFLIKRTTDQKNFLIARIVTLTNLK